MGAPAVSEEPSVAPPAAHPDAAPRRAHRERRPLLGRYAFVLGALMVLVVAVALLVDAPDRYLEATVLALVADALSVAAIVVGIVAIARRRAVALAVIGIVVAVLGNPLVLLYGLGALA